MFWAQADQSCQGDRSSRRLHAVALGWIFACESHLEVSIDRCLWQEESVVVVLVGSELTSPSSISLHTENYAGPGATPACGPHNTNLLPSMGTGREMAEAPSRPHVPCCSGSQCAAQPHTAVSGKACSAQTYVTGVQR